MSSRRTHSIPVLALCLGLFASVCVAGEKIEFSAPSIPLSSSVPEKEQKDSSPVTSLNLGSGNGAMEPIFGPAPVMMVPSTHAKKSDWLHPDKADVDAKNNAAAMQDWASRTSHFDHSTNQWGSMDKGWNSSSQADSMQKRSDDLSRNSTDSYSRSASGYDKSSAQDEMGHMDRKSMESVWSSTFASRGPSLSDQLRLQQQAQLEELKALYQLPNSTAPAGSPSQSSDPLHNYTWPKSEAGFDTAFRATRDKPEETFTQPSRSYRAVQASRSDSIQAQPTYQHSAYATPQPQTRSQPAVLPFPKRPGDLLK